MRHAATAPSVRSSAHFVAESLERRALLAVGGPSLLADIFAGASPSMAPGSQPTRSAATLPGVVIFAANDGTRGTELWKTDGTPGGTAIVADISTGLSATGAPNSSGPGFIATLNGVAYFAATEASGGRELWRSDGTAAGTRRVKDIFAGPASSGPTTPVATTDAVYFWANDGASGTELWKTDGTEAGTVMVKDLTPGSGSSSSRTMFAVGNTVYFAFSDAATGTELWKTDGTAAGTGLVKDLTPGTASTTPVPAAAFNGQLYFTMYDSTVGTTRLYRTDGTADGTAVVTPATVGVLTGTQGGPQGTSAMAAFDGFLYFAATDAAGAELWRTDGTPQGTTMVADVATGGTGSSPAGLTAFGGRLFFTAAVGATGREWYTSDGTAGGTTLFKDILPGVSSSSPVPLAVTSDGRLYFRAVDGPASLELHVTDGTPAGTYRVDDLAPGEKASVPGLIGTIGDGLIFVADNGSTGPEPWHVSAPTRRPPTARITLPTLAYEGNATSVGGGNSSDPVGTIARYEWDLNYDGVTFDVDSTASLAMVPTLDDGPGTRRVALRVYNDQNVASAVAVGDITIANVAPTLTLTEGAAIDEGSTFQLGLSATDPGRDTISSWTVNWGDGTSTTYTPGFPAGGGGGDFASASHRYADDGTYTITGSATDEDGIYNFAARTIAVRSVAPTLSVTGQPEVDEGTPYAITFGATDPGADTIAKWTVDWGDGVVDTLPGTAVGATHAYADGPATREVRVSATDEDGTYAAAVTGGYGAPAAVNLGSSIQDAAPAANGATYAVGLDGGSSWFIARYRADGTSDPTFGSGGRSAAPTGLNQVRLLAVAARPDGGAVAVGDYWTGTRRALLVAHYRADGLLLRGIGFGSVNGLPLGAGNDVAIMPDGRVVVALNAGGIAAVRLTSQLDLDATFGTGGLASSGFGSRATAVAVMADGRVVVAGDTAGGNFNSQFAAVRFAANGTLDQTFGTGGRASINVPGEYDEGHAVAVDAAGRVAIVGRSQAAFDAPSDAVAVLLNASGTPDARFDGDGILFDDINSSIFNTSGGALFLPDGDLLLGYGAGSAGDVRFRRFDANAAPDARFGPGGVLDVATGIGVPAAVQSLYLDPAGRATGLAIDPYVIGRSVRLTFPAFVGPTLAVRVRNVAPTLTLAAEATRIDELGTIRATGTGADQGPTDAARLAYAWTVRRYGVTVGSGTGRDVSFAPRDDGQYQVTMTVTDPDGATAQAFTTVEIDNVAPTAASVTMPATAVEGDAVTISVAGLVDGADDLGSLRLSYDVNGDGDFADAGDAFDTAATSWTFTPDDDGSRAVRVVVSDRQGASTAYVRTLDVTNATPSVVLTPATPGGTVDENTPLSFAMAAGDAGAADVAAGLILGWKAYLNGDLVHFANGTSSFDYTPTRPGTLEVVAQVGDKDGATAVATATYVVENVDPTLAIAGPTTPAVEGSATTLELTATDTANDFVSYRWTVERGGTVVASGSGRAVSFTPDRDGAYLVRGTATDDDGATGTATYGLDVANVAPTASINVGTNPAEGVPVTLGALVVDPGADDATFGHAWTVSRNGVTVATGSGASLTFTPADSGTYVATLVVTDSDGAQATATRSFAVANVAPVATISGSTSVKKNKPASFTFGASDVAADAAARFTYRIDWDGDGRIDQTVTAGTSINLSYKYARAGRYNLTVFVTDKDGSTGTKMLAITVG